MLRTLRGLFARKQGAGHLVVDQGDHPIHQRLISKEAINVLHKLHKAGYAAYLVGGGVRDLLLNHKPKDYDIATNASPEKIRRIFKNSRIIGRRFRLVHVYFGREFIEVATFRGAGDDNKKDASGMILRDNVFGSISEDAVRRDFTINALYYDYDKASIVDYTQGLEDIDNKTVRLIGDPNTRFREDPVRILRAIRLMSKLGFALEEKTHKSLVKHIRNLRDVAGARLFEEIVKMFSQGCAAKNAVLLQEFAIFPLLFPDAAKHLQQNENKPFPKLVWLGLTNSDARVKQDKSLNPAFLYAVFLWLPMQARLRKYLDRGDKLFVALFAAMDETLAEQVKTIAVPKRFTLIVRDIWLLQFRFEQRRNKRAYPIVADKRFRAGYDFLLLRKEAGEDVSSLVDWWTTFYEGDEKVRKALLEKSRGAGAGQKRRRRRRRQ